MDAQGLLVSFLGLKNGGSVDKLTFVIRRNEPEDMVIVREAFLCV